MKKFIVLMAVCFSASAMPFYFYTGLGSSGSIDRGLGHEVAEVGFGVEAYNNGVFGVDIELGYTTEGTVKGRPIMLASKAEPAPTTYVAEDPKPVEINIPGVLGPVIALPVVVLDIPIPLPISVPEPEPEPPPIDEGGTDVAEPECGDDFCYDYDTPMGPAAVGTKMPKATTATPTIQNDIFSITVNPKIKVNDFIWLNLRFGVDKKMTDGEIKNEIIDKESRSIQWYNDTHFSDDTVTYHVGAGGVFKFRKQLAGYAKADWYDMSESIQGNDFQTDDVVVIAGLRFLF